MESSRISPSRRIKKRQCKIWHKTSRTSIEKQWFEKGNERDPGEEFEWFGFNDEQWSSIKNPTIDKESKVEEIIDPIIQPNTNPNEEQNPEFKANFNWTIWHEWFIPEDEKQQAVQYAYKLWGMELVSIMECENGNRDVNAIWDNGHAFGLCQMNERFHKIPEEYFGNRRVQVEYCYQKRKSWTTFYWPDRIIKGTNQRCKNYVKSRFTITE